MPRAILFDLDGTLVDTRAASYELFAETNRAFKLGIDTREAFFAAFEGNFFESLARLCPDARSAAAAKQHFMELLRTRYRPALIPGMIDVVRALAPHCTLAVISTNGIEAIRRILVDAGIATCFSHVFSGDVQPKKSASIRRFLGDQRYAAQRCCSPEYREDTHDGPALQAADVVLVTDTAGDVAEAREAGIHAVGVAWGMHSERQLLDAGAEKVALWPQELVAWLRPSGCDANAACACDLRNGASDTPTLATPLAAQAAACDIEAGALSPEAASVSSAARLRLEERGRVRAARLCAMSHALPERARPPVFAAAALDAELLRALRRIVSVSA